MHSFRLIALHLVDVQYTRWTCSMLGLIWWVITSLPGCNNMFHRKVLFESLRWATTSKGFYMDILPKLIVYRSSQSVHFHQTIKLKNLQIYVFVVCFYKLANYVIWNQIKAENLCICRAVTLNWNKNKFMMK